MSNKEENRHNNKFNNAKLIIDQTIYKFLIILIRDIFLKRRNTSISRKISNKLNDFVQYINANLLENNKKPIKVEYSKENFENIIEFVRSQNKIFAGEIIENILIIVFSLSFKTKKENTFGKYIYNNLSKIKDAKNLELANWFLENDFKDNIKLKEFLQNDIFGYEKDIKDLKPIQKDSFFNFLEKINKEEINTSNKFPKKKFLSYMKGTLFFIEKIKKQNNNNNNSDTEAINSLTTVTSLMSNYLYEDEIGKIKKVSVKLIRSLFISTYIYYQNRNSPLMKYRKKNNHKKNKELKEKENSEDLEFMPFVFNLSEALIDSKYVGIIFSPLRNQPRIDEIKMDKNRLKENGLLELSKVLLFNKNIKKIDFNTCMLKSQYIEFFNYGIKLFNNNSVEVLNL